MSERGIHIPITATDSASADLKKVGAAAKQLGQDVEQSGKQVERGFRGVKFSAMEVGAAIGSVVGGVAKLGQASRNHEREVDALGRAYGTTTDDMLAFSEAIQDNTNFSNDQARAAELNAATLIRNYGFTTAEVQKLIAVSADLAAATGTTLTDATQRVVAAMRGEAESAETLGLTLNQQSIDRQNLTLTMSNEEAAHFRLNALLKQAAFAEGAAGDAAEGAAGKGQAVIDWLDDAAESAGSALGPIGEFAGQFGELALLAPIAGAGIGKMVASANAAKIATGSLNLALGPVGLIAAVVGVGAALFEMNRRAEESKLSLGEIEDSTGDLIATLNRLREEGADTEVLVGVRQGVEFMQDLGRASNEAEGRIEEVNIALFQQQRILEDLILSQATPAGALDETLVARIEAQKQLVAELENTQAALEGTIVDSEQFDAAMAATNAVLAQSSRINYPELVAEVTRLQVALINGEIDADEYTAAIIALNENAGSFGLTLDSLAPKIALVTDRLGAGNDAAGDLAVGLGVVTGEVVKLDFAIGNATGGMSAMGDETGNLGDEIGGLETEVRTFSDAVEDFLSIGERRAAVLAHEADVLATVAAGEAALNQEIAEGIATREQGIAAQRAENDERQRAIEAAIAQAEAIAANDQAMRGSVDSMQAVIAGLDSVRLGAYLAADGVLSLADQSSYLTQVNEELAVSSDALGGSISESTSLLGDLEEGYDILNQRRTEGQALSQAELDFLAAYDQRVATATENVDDWQVAQALLAGQQLDNIEAQEGLTEAITEAGPAMADLADVLGDFVDAYREANGLPPLDNLAPPDGLAASWRDVTSAFDTAMAAAQGRSAAMTGVATQGSPGIPGTAYYGDQTGGMQPAASGFRPAPTNQAPPPQGLLSPQVAVTPIVVPIVMDATSLERGVQNIAVYLEGTIGEPVTMVILGDGEDAIAVIEDVDSNVRAVVTEDHVVFIEGNADGALSDAEAVTLAMDAIDGDTSTVTVDANTDPFWTHVRGTLGFLGDAYVNVHANRVGFQDLGLAYGGVVSAAQGRLVRAGEVGPEWVDTPGGGGYMAAKDGLYVMETGSRVHNAASTRASGMGRGGGLTVNLTVAGNVYGIDGLTELMTREIAPALAEALRSHDRAMGI